MSAQPVQAKANLSFEDALDHLLELQNLTELDELDEDIVQVLPRLVQVTVKWTHTVHRSWKAALACARRNVRPHPGRDLETAQKTQADALIEDMTQLIACYTIILVKAFFRDPSAEWAIRCLVLLCDDNEKLYRNWVSTAYYGGGVSAGAGDEEGATFLQGYAGRIFRKLGGYDAMKKALEDAEPSVTMLLVSLLRTLVDGRECPEEAVHLQNSLVAASKILQLSPTELVTNREHLDSTMRDLLYLTDDGNRIEQMDRSPQRVGVEAAWWLLISTGICSTNLLARRGCAEFLGEARRIKISPRQLTKWLREDNIFEELFGSRQDLRVLEDLSLDPLCERSQEGLRALLDGVRPVLGKQILAKKLHSLAMRAPEFQPLPEWGRDLIVLEITRWCRPLIAEGSADAVAFVAGFYAMTYESFGRQRQVFRIFPFIADDDAVQDSIYSIVDAMLSPVVTPEQLIELEAAFLSARDHRLGPLFRGQILERLAADVEAAATAARKAAEDGKRAEPLRGAVLRTLLRLLETYPFEADCIDEEEEKDKEDKEKKEDGQNKEDSINLSRRMVVTSSSVEGRSVPLSEQMWFELQHMLPTVNDPEGIEAVKLRLRTICYICRCSPDLVISSERLADMVAVLNSSPDGWCYICYLLRIASPAPVHVPEPDRSFCVLSEEALSASLTLVEDLALKHNGLNIFGFVCLQQAILLVNGASGQLKLLNNSGKPASAQRIVAGDIQPSGAVSDLKLTDEQLVGTWVKVYQDSEGNWKIARVGKLDAVTGMFDLEYIDESRHLRKLRALRFEPVPSLLEQRPFPPTVSSVKSVEKLPGMRGLWACALGGSDSDDHTAADLAAALLLSLHRDMSGTRALLVRLRQELCAPSTPMAVNRCLAMLETLVQEQPPSQARSHIGVGFPMKLKIAVYAWVQGRPEWVQSKDGWKEEARSRRQRINIHLLTVHSQMTIAELHCAVGTLIGRELVRIALPDHCMYLPPHSRQTLEEIDLTPQSMLEAEASECLTQKPVDGPLDSLEGDGEWSETLLALLEGSPVAANLSPTSRSLCWRLLLQLPTYGALDKTTRNVPEDACWADLLSKDHIWHSTYIVLLIEALAGPLQREECSSKSWQMSDAWLTKFRAAGGTKALLELFLEAFSGSLGDLELSSLLPALIRSVGACIFGGTGSEPMLKDVGCELLGAAVNTMRWSLESSQKCIHNATPWKKLRLRHASADSLDILVEVTRRVEVPLSMLDEQVLPLLLELVQSMEGAINVRVSDAIADLARRPDCAQRMLQRMAVAVPVAAEKLASKKRGELNGGLTSLCDTILGVVSILEPTAAPEEHAMLLQATVQASLISKVGVTSLYKLLATLLRHAAENSEAIPLEPVVAQCLADRLLSCVLSESPDDVGSDETREAGAGLLLQLVRGGSWKMRRRLQHVVSNFIVEVQAPSTWDFEPAVPEAPETLSGRPRNKTGHVGLVNRGMTCYMNSTVQQLFWAQPFRRAVLSSPPPLAAEGSKPKPLPHSTTGKETAIGSKGAWTAPEKEDADTLPMSPTGSFLDDEERESVTSSASDVGWQLQRAFTYLQDCQQGLYDTDALVDSCTCLHLEYSVKSQNDASEFLDKVCDKIDEVCQPFGDPPMKPSQAFMTKTCREKHCHHCGLRAKAAEESMIRVQINNLAPTLEECFQNLIATESMVGDNRVMCDKCGENQDTSYRTYFTHLPQVIVIHLCRMSFDYETLQRVKLNDLVAFPMKLNMSKYTEDAILHGHEVVPGCSYELQGVQVHQGSAGGGHYYSFVHDNTGKWFKFNDERVSPFDLEQLQEECFGGESAGYSKVQKTHNAYMLFYRCVEATPYSSHSTQAQPLETPTLHRSNTNPKELPSVTALEELTPPKLKRAVSEFYSTSEHLQDRMQRRRQAQLSSSLKKEITNINEQLHRHAVVFSPVTLKFLCHLTSSLCTELRDHGIDEDEKSAILSPRRLGSLSSVQEGLCRLTAKAWFDVVLHAKSTDAEKLEQWVALFAMQLQQEAGSAAPAWLMAKLCGQPDEILGRRSCPWLPQALFQCDRNDRPACIQAVINIVLLTAEANVQRDAAACQDFLLALLSLMRGLDRCYAMHAFGELWRALVGSAHLRPLLSKIRGHGGLSVASLLLHCFCGSSYTPLDSPPAPPLPAVGVIWPSWGTAPVLAAVAGLLDTWAESAEEPVLTSPSLAFWRALAIRNPEFLEMDGPIRQRLPQDENSQVLIGRVILERLRPSGMENTMYSEHLRGALAYLASQGIEEVVEKKLASLCQVGEALMQACVTASRTGHAGVWYQSGSQDTRAAKNVDALQLLRLLQAVAKIGRPLPESWIWARDWLAEVCKFSQKRRWENQGVPIAEAMAVRDALKGPGGQAQATQDVERSENDVIVVTCAGSLEVNGVYSYLCELEGDGSITYAHNENADMILTSQRNKFGDVRWIVEDNQFTYYKTIFVIANEDQPADSPYPPLDEDEWLVQQGEEPAPSLRVVHASAASANIVASNGSVSPTVTASARPQLPPTIDVTSPEPDSTGAIDDDSGDGDGLQTPCSVHSFSTNDISIGGSPVNRDFPEIPR